MELRFGASEEREPPLFTDPPPRRRLPPPAPMGTSGFFHDQAMQDYIGLEVDLPIHRRPAIEQLARELHKERIIEEILARRIVQRRMLEEQAWREMEMERGVMMERFQIERLREPLPIMPHESRLGPHLVRRHDVFDQQIPLHVGRRQDEFDEQLALGGSYKIELVNEPLKISETKAPEGSIPRTKRKIAATISGTCGPKFRKPKQDWSCALCQVSMMDEESLNMHLKGKKHLAKISELSSSKNSGEPSLIKNKSTTQSSSSTPKPAAQHMKGHGGGKKVQIQVDGKMHDVVERGIFLWCMVCAAKCNSQKVMADHIRGKKHLLEVSKRKLEEAGTEDAEDAENK